MGIAIFGAYILPLAEKGESRIRDWLDLKDPENFSANEKSNREVAADFLNTADLHQKYNKKGLTPDQVYLFLKKSTLISRQEIKELLRNE